ncbi:MAG TPA: NAD-dependent epimerase/dehydratase family protein [Acetobacteraceae bacterium]|nr:NAD-dependent epimerase/dehydratase family protein [Acetobacteraceae bacterium]
MSCLLVTGGAGFIGSHLADALLAQGHRVRILDDFSSGQWRNVPSGTELIRGDVADEATVAAALADADGCFHLAAIASVERGNNEWLAAHRVNLTGTITVFEAARRRGVPVVYASSAAVFGDNPEPPFAEDAALRPLSAYGADKLGCELHARAGGRVHGLRTAGLRFFNVYGPRQDPHSPYSGVISIFGGRLRRGLPLIVFGDGEQVRDFVYVADVVQALLAALDAASAEAPVFNICTGRPTSVRALAAAMGAVLGIAPDLRFAPPRPGDIRASLGDPTRAAASLGWEARTALADGLRATLAAL